MYAIRLSVLLDLVCDRQLLNVPQRTTLQVSGCCALAADEGREYTVSFKPRLEESVDSPSPGVAGLSQGPQGAEE